MVTSFIGDKRTHKVSPDKKAELYLQRLHMGIRKALEDF